MKKNKILVIDDNEMFRLMVITFLRKIGDYQLLEARDGKEGLEVFRKENPQLIITDLKLSKRLSKMPGEEVIRIIKRAWPKMKIIAMSGDHEREGVAKAAGCDEFLKKPFELLQFKEAVELLLKK